MGRPSTHTNNHSLIERRAKVTNNKQDQPGNSAVPPLSEAPAPGPSVLGDGAYPKRVLYTAHGRAAWNEEHNPYRITDGEWLPWRVGLHEQQMSMIGKWRTDPIELVWRALLVLSVLGAILAGFGIILEGVGP